MKNLYNITGKVVLGICLFGVCRKTYEWGIEYIEKDVANILLACDIVKDSVKNKLNKKKEA